MFKNACVLFCIIINISFLSAADAQYSAQPFISISIYKAGTHLLNKCVELLTHKEPVTFNRLRSTILEKWGNLFEPSLAEFDEFTNLLTNEYLFLHLYYNTDYKKLLMSKNFKILLIIRDPRDQIISYAYFIQKFPQFAPQLHSLPINNIIDACISDIQKVYSKFLPWAKFNTSYTVKFEDLVGFKGGGTQGKQLREIYNIGSHIGLDMTWKKSQEVSNQLFGGTATFREGKIGSWKTHFTVVQKQAFKEVAGDLLIELGYEKDKNW